jgi:pyridoxamine 5'-phosphate oxidase
LATDLHNIRTDYFGKLLPHDIAAQDPWRLFAAWMDQAIAAHLPEATAMHVATVGEDGRPSTRVVLLKHFSTDGLEFFTNYHSRKGQQLAANPYAAVSFFWPAPSRQVRARGPVRKLDREESVRYFHSRPHGSQIAASISKQSEPIDSRAQLEAEIIQATERIGDGEVPVPEHWGGYLIDVEEFEFWQGMPSRVHDRARFVRTADGWQGTRLYP